MSLDISLHVDVDTGGEEPFDVCLADMNITHNLTPMWGKAGVYEALYESEGTRAQQWLDVLRAGVADMEQKPAEYEALNALNGWGLYENALPWLRDWLAACEAHPLAIIHVSA